MATNTFQSIYSELVGDIPRLDVLKSKLIVNDAWRDIRDARLWSFLVAECTLLAPNLTNSGSGAVTFGSKAVVVNSTAAAAINAIPSQTPVTLQQFRVSYGPVYNIVAWNPGTLTLTLDRIYAESTAASTQFQIYQCYYQPPSDDFLRWVTVIDPINGYQFVDVTLSKRDIDTRDPLRGAINQPYYMASYKINTLITPPVPSYEMWPHPQQSIGYMCLYQRIGTDLDDVTNPTIPATIPRSLILSRARFYAYRWAASNAGRWPELLKGRWGELMQNSGKEYEARLVEAENADEEVYLQNYSAYQRPLYFLGPLTGAYLQSHDGWGLFGGY